MIAIKDTSLVLFMRGWLSQEGGKIETLTVLQCYIFCLGQNLHLFPPQPQQVSILLCQADVCRLHHLGYLDSGGDWLVEGTSKNL